MRANGQHRVSSSVTLGAIPTDWSTRAAICEPGSSDSFNPRKGLRGGRKKPTDRETTIHLRAIFKWGSLTMLLAYSPPLWAEHGETPIWLRITDSDWRPTQGIRERLAAAALGLPNHVCEYEGEPYVGINLPVGVDVLSITDSVIKQVVYFATKTEEPSNAT